VNSNARKSLVGNLLGNVHLEDRKEKGGDIIRLQWMVLTLAVLNLRFCCHTFRFLFKEAFSAEQVSVK